MRRPRACCSWWKAASPSNSQAPRTPGIHLVAIADLSPDRARESLRRVGWEADRAAATSFQEAARAGTTFITDDADALISSDHVEIVIDATGSPAAGIHHVLQCCRFGKHVIMVNVEADVLAGIEGDLQAGVDVAARIGEARAHLETLAAAARSSAPADVLARPELASARAAVAAARARAGDVVNVAPYRGSTQDATLASMAATLRSEDARLAFTPPPATTMV